MRVDEFKSLVARGGGLAQSNRFQVILPQVAGSPLNINDLNILCKEASLPGRQMTSVERTIGLHQQKVAWGYATTDTNLTFHLLNDYGVRKHFELWQNLVVDQNTFEVGYYNDYVKPVTIYQLDKNGNKKYGVQLLEAYPTTMNSITLNNTQDEVVELSVSLSYKNWKKIG